MKDFPTTADTLSAANKARPTINAGIKNGDTKYEWNSSGGEFIKNPNVRTGYIANQTRGAHDTTPGTVNPQFKKGETLGTPFRTGADASASAARNAAWEKTAGAKWNATVQANDRATNKSLGR